MSNATNALEELIGNHLLRDATWSKPSDIYVALYTVMPAEDGTGGTEVTGGSYTRIKCGPSDSAWTGPIGGTGIYTNTSLVQFPLPTANWGDVAGFGFLSAASSGTLYLSKAFDEAFTINVGDPAPGFAPGTLTVTFA